MHTCLHTRYKMEHLCDIFIGHFKTSLLSQIFSLAPPSNLHKKMPDAWKALNMHNITQHSMAQTCITGEMFGKCCHIHTRAEWGWLQAFRYFPQNYNIKFMIPLLSISLLCSVTQRQNGYVWKLLFSICNITNSTCSGPIREDMLNKDMCKPNYVKISTSALL